MFELVLIAFVLVSGAGEPKIFAKAEFHRSFGSREGCEERGRDITPFATVVQEALDEKNDGTTLHSIIPVCTAPGRSI